jgi:hypothetical protein
VASVVNLVGRTFGALLALVVCGAGLWLASHGFEATLRLRELERLPESTRMGAVLPGDVMLRGIARPAGLVAGSPLTGTPSLYYRFLHEVEAGDADAAVRRETRVDRAEAVDFVLADASGRIRVAAQRDFVRIDFHALERYSATEGRNRYTEWRIEPGDELVLFGRARMTPSGMEVGFRETAGPPPLVSAFAAEGERRAVARTSLPGLWAGLALLALGAGGLALALGVHRVLAFLTLVACAIALLSAQFGVQMIRADLIHGLETQQVREVAARVRFGRELRRVGLPFESIRALGPLDGPDLAVLPRETRGNLQAIREELELMRLRLDRRFSARSGGWLAPVLGITRPESRSWLPEVERVAVGARHAANPTTAIAGPWASLLGAGAVLVSVLLGWLGLRRVRARRCLERVPSLRSREVVSGLVHLEGVVEAPAGAEPPTAPLAAVPCVWFDYRVEERRSWSGGGRGWTVVEHRREAMPFLCRDEAGALMVDPEGSDCVTHHRMTRREGGRRVTEQRIELGDRCSVVGFAAVGGASPDQLILRAAEGASLTLANLSGRALRCAHGVPGLWLLAASLTVLVLAVLLLGAVSDGFTPADFLVAALASVAWLAIVTLVLRLFDLEFLREQARRGWVGVQVSLRRRSRLLRPLNTLVTKYLVEEQELQACLVKLGSELRRATEDPRAAGRFLATERALDQGLRAVIDGDPRLKSAKAVAQLTDALSRLQSEVALLRAGYDAATERYHARLNRLPDLLLARAARFEPMRSLD